MKKISNILFFFLSLPFVIILWIVTKFNRYILKYSLLKLFYAIILGLCYQCIIFAKLLSFNWDLRPVAYEMEQDFQLLKK